MVGCSFKSKVGRYHDGELDAADAAQVEQHLLLCSDCAAELDEVRAISLKLSSIVIPAASTQFLRRLQASADRIEQLALVRFVLRLTAVAAAVLLAGRLYSVYAEPKPPRNPVGLAAWEQKAIAPDLEASANGEAPFAEFMAAGLAGGRQ